MKKIIYALVTLLIFVSLAKSDEYKMKAYNLYETINSKFITKLVISTVLEQNKQHENLSEADILALDKKWIEKQDKALIDSKINNKLARYFRSLKSKHGKVYTEIFAMDNKGLIVAASEPTTDYWQGDEKKWLDTYGTGYAYSFYISERYLDESTQKTQVQLSIPLVSDDKVIGAITFGILSEKI